MTKKDYIAIARAINTARELNDGGKDTMRIHTALHQTAHLIADELIDDNIRFQRRKFIAACGFEE